MRKTTPPIYPKTNAALDKFLRAVNIFRKIDTEFPMQYALCLVEIARSEGMSLTDLAERTGMALSTVSRVVGALSNYRSNSQPYQLVEMKVAKNERRRKELYLTEKGRMAIAELESLLSPVPGR